MARAAEPPAVGLSFAGLAAQVRLDLQPFPGRAGMMWRTSLLCAIVAMVAMMYRIPEPALSCYLIIFLMNPNSAQCVGKAIGLIVLVSLIVLIMMPIANVTIQSQTVRMLFIAALSFAPVYLGAATKVGEIGSIIALVFAFVLTLVDMVPVGEVATRGLLYAWQMAAMPMALMVVFLLVFGFAPRTLILRTLRDRLSAVADFLERPGAETRERLSKLLRQGNDQMLQLAQVSGVLALTNRAATQHLAARSEASYRLLLGAAALADDGPGWRATSTIVALAENCRAAEQAMAEKREPSALLVAAGDDVSRPVSLMAQALADFAEPPADAGAKPRPQPFLKPDAFSNPEYTAFALKVTLAAILAYIAYSAADWQGIHTALVTCYVASLGTTGETVRKLLLRISGALVGAALGIGSIVFIVPHLSSIADLMALVFFGTLLATWVSNGPERIAYAGVQVGLAFLLTVLNGFQPSTDLSVASDRVIGILVGNLIVYVIFTSLWPKSAMDELRGHLSSALSLLARLATLPPGDRVRAVGLAGEVGEELEGASASLEVVAFEPARLQPPRAEVLRLADALRQAEELLPKLFVSPEALEPLSASLARAGMAVDKSDGEPARAATIPHNGAGDGSDLGSRVSRIEKLVTEI